MNYEEALSQVYENIVIFSYFLETSGIEDPTDIARLMMGQVLHSGIQYLYVGHNASAEQVEAQATLMKNLIDVLNVKIEDVKYES